MLQGRILEPIMITLGGAGWTHLHVQLYKLNVIYLILDTLK